MYYQNFDVKFKFNRLSMDAVQERMALQFGGGGSPPPPPAPPPPPPPPPAPEPAPTADTAGDEEAARKRASVKAQGRSSTVLTGGEGDTSEAEVNKKKLLGQ